ncbi:hypothetical protein [Clostridium sp. OS1-26]|uniref:hypothetical protein n=1 Tax=Clostridium sp. OS1-26 TaxID=3070681 RepID=UPI0027E1BEAB|nr:hypothetical protein [Clostridium sp. OS1-26]WML33311.1 hypothetical protein RCG18_18420 [Clostridium sp. OS1-26]
MNEIISIDKILYSKVSLEKDYREETNKLGWGDYTDVLYSFLGVFVVGLKVYCGSNEYANLKKILDKEIQINGHQREYSWNFIRTFVKHYSEQDKDNKIKIAVDELKNLKEMKEFINVYNSIGNVFPIWPGGNIHRGTNGCYDIPDIYFNKGDIRNYSEHFFNTFCTSNFMEKIIDGDYCTFTPNSILNFDREEYRKFLIHIHDTICEREEKINITLKLLE